MRIGIAKRSLAEAAAMLERIAPAKASQPVLGQLLVEARQGTTTLRASSGELDLELRLPAEVEGEGAVLVPAGLFSQLVRALPGEYAELRRVPGGLELEGGSFRTRLAVADPEAFPDFPEPAGEGVRLAGEVLARAIGRVRYAAAHEEYRAIFRGIQLELRPDRLRAVATDGFRLAVFDAEGVQGPDLKPVVPARAADELVRVLKEAAGEVTLHPEPARVVVAGERFRMAIALMEGSFPDYERVIPAQFALEATVDAEALRQAIERVRVLADRQSQRVDLAFGEGRVELAAEGEYGSGREELPLELSGETPMVVAYNAQYLIDALKGLKGPARLRLSGPTSPSLLTGGEEPGYLAVVVPLRV